MGLEKNKIALIAILLLALLLRAYMMDKPFNGQHNFNEGYYSSIADEMYRNGTLHITEYIDVVCPVLVYILYASFSIFGSSEFAARLPLVLFGTASILFFYLITKKYYGERTALAAALLAATMPGIVYFSRNVQIEGVLGAEIFASLWLLMEYREKGGAWRLAVAGLLICLLGFTKPFGILALPALLYALWFYSPKRIRKATKHDKIRETALLILLTVPASVWHILRAASEADRIYYVRTWGVGWIMRAFGELPLNLFQYINPCVMCIGVALLIFLAVSRKINLKQHGLMLVLIVPWYLILFTHPAEYIGNTYYDYIAWFGLTALFAWALFEAETVLSKRIKKYPEGLAVVILALLILTNILLYANYVRGVIIWCNGEAYPFETAKRIGQIGFTGPILIDSTAAVYYMHTNLSRVTLCPSVVYPSNEAFRNMAYGGKYEFAVSYLQQLNETEEIPGYAKISPCAWRKTQ